MTVAQAVGANSALLPPAALVQLLRSLSVLPDSQLALAITQKPELCSLATSTLHHVALFRLGQPIPTAIAADADAVAPIVTILKRLIERGDPSLARKLIPTPGSIVDLAIAASSVATTSVRDVLERLLDAYTTAELVAGLESQFSEVLATTTPTSASAEAATDSCISIRSSARILAAFLAACPLHAEEGTERSIRSLASLLAKAYQQTLPAVAEAVEAITVHTLEQIRLDAGSWQLHWLTAKVDLLQATHRLLTVCFDRSSPLAKLEQLQSCVLASLASSQVDSSSSASVSLVSADLIEDLAEVFALHSQLSHASNLDERAQTALARIQHLEAAQTPSTGKFSGAGWAALQRFQRQQRSETSGRARVRANDSEAALGNGSFSPDETLIGTVNSILPHMEIDELRIILARPSFRGQSAEEVIQRLLEGDQGEEARAAAQRPPSPEYVPPPPTAAAKNKLVRSRANVFDDTPLDLSKASWNQSNKGKGKGKDKDLGTISSDLKAAILARAEADSDEDEEEWNPFAEAGQQRTVGVEDELDLDYEGREVSHARPNEDDNDDDEPEGLQRRMGTISLSSSRPSTLEYSRYELESEDDSEQLDGAPAAPPSGAELERAAERALIRHYSRHGAQAFAKDAATRKSAQRRELRQQLESVGGRRWDDGLIESWATMFERNPRKDKLLASANDILLNAPASGYFAQDQSRQEHGSGDGEERRFGPDRGRGGRVLRDGGSGGRGGGGGGGGRGGGPSRGRGTGHSGTDRNAKMKEKRGNQARKRGFDKKVARGAAGAAG